MYTMHGPHQQQCIQTQLPSVLNPIHTHSPRMAALKNSGIHHHTLVLDGEDRHQQLCVGVSCSLSERKSRRTHRLFRNWVCQYTQSMKQHERESESIRVNHARYQYQLIVYALSVSVLRTYSSSWYLSGFTFRAPSTATNRHRKHNAVLGAALAFSFGYSVVTTHNHLVQCRIELVA